MYLGAKRRYINTLPFFSFPLMTTDEPESVGCYKPVSAVKFYGGRKSYGQRSERTRKRPAKYSD